MTDENHLRMLHAAARVYAQHGWRGSTTRRIAEEAGVNEVTLFRHFGSKDALLEQMMRAFAAREEAGALPWTPVAPEVELLTWVSAHHGVISSMRAFVRQLMSDAEERPDLAGCAAHGPASAAGQLRGYTDGLRRTGFIHESVSAVDVSAAVTMLMGAMFADAMNRDLMPTMFSQSVEESLRAYVRIFLRGVGALAEPTLTTGRTVDPSSTLTTASE